MLLGTAGVTLAQHAGPAVVTVQATDPSASTSGDPGAFTISRAGGPPGGLTVFFRVSGTAVPGVDYLDLGQLVNLGPGEGTVVIPVVPLTNSPLVSTQTVVLEIIPSLLANPLSDYEIGDLSKATVFIQGPPATNRPPVVLPSVTVAATVPTATEPCGTNPAVAGKFTVSRDSHTNVDFVVWYAVAGTARNGVDYVHISNAVVIPTGAWSADIPITPLANQSLAAIETVELVLLPNICPALWPPPPDCYEPRNPASATVLIQGCLPGTNQPPIVRLISPPDHAAFRSPVDLPLYAYASEPGGTVASVEFLAGTNSLGFGQTIIVTNLWGGPPPQPPFAPPTPISSNLFVLVWTNPPTGAYALTARATDGSGLTSVSAPVNITILGPWPPAPTNSPTLVSIVATDPIAVEGTNCWVWAGLTNSTGSWSNWPGAIPHLFTNCGPKNAAFTLNRFGDTNAALTVNYTVGGTASNGVDYATLPVTATIAAGARSVLIPVIPIDSTPPATNLTVVLQLAGSTNYAIGHPARAAALIVDNGWMPPRVGAGTVPSVLGDQCFHLNAAGPNGAWFQILYSTNVFDWTPICTNQVINGSVDFIDPDASSNHWRFYRAVPQAHGPQ